MMSLGRAFVTVDETTSISGFSLRKTVSAAAKTMLDYNGSVRKGPRANGEAGMQKGMAVEGRPPGEGEKVG